jgi:hypothetical protein
MTDCGKQFHIVGAAWLNWRRTMSSSKMLLGHADKVVAVSSKLCKLLELVYTLLAVWQEVAWCGLVGVIVLTSSVHVVVSASLQQKCQKGSESQYSKRPATVAQAMDVAASSVSHLRMWRNALMWKYDDLHTLSTCWLKNSVSSITIPRLLTLWDSDMSGASVNGANHLLSSLTCTNKNDYGFRLLGIQAQLLTHIPSNLMLE